MCIYACISGVENNFWTGGFLTFLTQVRSLICQVQICRIKFEILFCILIFCSKENTVQGFIYNIQQIGCSITIKC